MIALVRNDAIEDLHLVLLRLFQQEDFRIHVAHVVHARLHVRQGLHGPFPVVDDWCFAKMSEKAIEAFRAVLTRKAVDAKRNLEEGEPLAVGALRYVGLKLVGVNVFVLAAHACSCKQIAVFRYETRCPASIQEKEDAEQKGGYYEAFYAIHATKIRYLIHNS